jgi:hypothetical protein
MYITETASSGSFVVSTYLPWAVYGYKYRPSDNKDIRLKWRMALEKATGVARNWIGMCVTETDIHGVYTSVTNWLIRFVRDWSTLYAHNSNWTTATSTDVTSWVTMTAKNTYEIIFNPWVDIKYYINSNLVATHTTNLPTTWELLFSFWAHDDADVTAIELSPITLSLQI